MKQALLILLLALAPVPAPVAAQTAPSGLSGTWEASMVDPNNSDPATWPIGLRGGVPTTLRFDVEGDTIKGVVTVDTWPGDCDITGSKLAGTVSRCRWWAGRPGGRLTPSAIRCWSWPGPLQAMSSASR